MGEMYRNEMPDEALLTCLESDTGDLSQFKWQQLGAVQWHEAETAVKNGGSIKALTVMLELHPLDQ